MDIQTRILLRKYLLAVVDFALIMLATALSSLLLYGPEVNIYSHHTGATVFSTFFYFLFLYIFDCYNLQKIYQIKDIVFRVIAVFILGVVGTGFLFYSLGHWQFPRMLFAVQSSLAACGIILWRTVYFFWLAKTVSKERVLILGAGNAGQTLAGLLQGVQSPYEPIGFIDDDPKKINTRVNNLPVLGSMNNIEEILKYTGAKRIILAITKDRPDSLIESLMQIRLQGTAIEEMASVYEKFLFKIPVQHVQEQWLLFESGFQLITRTSVQHFKRLFDVSCSVFVLLLTSPVILLSAICIKLDSPGQVFYKQNRVGQGGKEFLLYKLRTMHNNAEQNGAVWARRNDPRVTRVGKWLRIFRLDELPQLFNVLKGDMSLIGPRPERIDFVNKLEEILPYYFIRHTVKPGITGWAQVNYPYGSTVEDALQKLEYELYYVKNMSLVLETQIFLKTIGVMLFGKGAR